MKEILTITPKAEVLLIVLSLLFLRVFDIVTFHWVVIISPIVITTVVVMILTFSNKFTQVKRRRRN